MKRTVFLILLILVNITVYGNDSRIIGVGNPELLSSDSTSIFINKEIIQLNLNKDDFSVIIDYEYYNPDDTMDVTLGFPIKIDSHSNKTFVSNFKTVFNNVVIDSLQENTIIKPNDNNQELYQWITRKVTFPGKAYTKSRITYSCEYSYNGFFSYANYILGSAKSWAGPIRSLDVLIEVSNNRMATNWTIGSFNQDSPSSDIRFTNGHFLFQFTNFALNGTENIRIFTSKYNNPYDASNFGDYYMGWAWGSHYIYLQPTENRSKNSKRILLLSKDQIQLFINCFYALHGYTFSNKDLYNYFTNNPSVFSGSDDIPEWKYTPTKYFNESMFNTIEKENLQYLRELKRKFYQ